MLEMLIAAGTTALAGLTAGLYANSERARLRRRAKGTMGRLVGALEAAGDPREDAKAKLETAAQHYSETLFQKELESSPLETLKEYGASGVRWSALKSAGILNLWDLERASDWTHRIQGIGATLDRALEPGDRQLQRAAPVRTDSHPNSFIGASGGGPRSSSGSMGVHRSATERLAKAGATAHRGWSQSRCLGID